MIEFLTIWVFMRPNTSVRKSSWRSLQRMPPRATPPPRRGIPSRRREWTLIPNNRRGGGKPPFQGLRVVVGADRQGVVPKGAQPPHVAPAESRQEDQAVQGIVGGPFLVEGAQGLREALVPQVQGGDPPLGRLQLEPVEEALAALGKRDRDAQVLGHREAQVLQRA